jgi:hypothetical protein
VLVNVHSVGIRSVDIAVAACTTPDAATKVCDGIFVSNCTIAFANGTAIAVAAFRQCCIERQLENTEKDDVWCWSALVRVNFTKSGRSPNILSFLGQNNIAVLVCTLAYAIASMSDWLYG